MKQDITWSCVISGYVTRCVRMTFKERMTKLDDNVNIKKKKNSNWTTVTSMGLIRTPVLVGWQWECFLLQELCDKWSHDFRCAEMDVMIARNRHHCVLKPTQARRTISCRYAESTTDHHDQLVKKLTFLSRRNWRSVEVKLFWDGSESLLSQPSCALMLGGVKQGKG